jgi:ABC-type spermidine/putrescine transport system permease subunit I
LFGHRIGVNYSGKAIVGQILSVVGGSVDFFNFKTFLSSSLIKVVFFLGLMLSVLGYIGAVGGTLVTQGGVEAAATFVLGGIGLVVAVVLWRVYCELAIVVFQIYDELKEIRQSLDSSSAEPGGQRGRQG